jgi:hypothetical protein
MQEDEQHLRAKVLQTAEGLINGDRAEIYGSPEDSFGRIARLWTAMGFKRTVTENGQVVADSTISAADVALMLVQLKVSRIISSPDHFDSWVDAAGYVALGAELAVGES